jgi:hypothetical protein
MSAVETAVAPQAPPTLDAPTLAAAAVTLLFDVVFGVVLSAMPQNGSLGGVLDSVKNLVYVLTVPLFDISRRVFAHRRRAAAQASAPTPAGMPNLLWIAFISALVIFMLVEFASMLSGFAMGSMCATLVQGGGQANFGQCFSLGVNVMSAVIIAPIMISLGGTAG